VSLFFYLSVFNEVLMVVMILALESKSHAHIATHAHGASSKCTSGQ
jgi:hypothetical protein